MFTILVSCLDEQKDEINPYENCTTWDTSLLPDVTWQAVEGELCKVDRIRFNSDGSGWADGYNAMGRHWQYNFTWSSDAATKKIILNDPYHEDFSGPYGYGFVDDGTLIFDGREFYK